MSNGTSKTVLFGSVDIGGNLLGFGFSDDWERERERERERESHIHIPCNQFQ